MVKNMLILLVILYLHIQPIVGRRENTLLDKLGIPRQRFDIHDAVNNRQLVTNLDELRELFVILRRISLGWANTQMKDLSQANREHGKMQTRMSRSQNFPCDTTYGRSPIPPITVNQLRPGDIDIIASFGDSLSAGNGVISENILHILNEHRGLTFSGGGYGNWRTYLTLPNILKVFNPNLYGYATQDGLVVDHNSHLNLAEPMLMSRDLPYQAGALIERLRRDPQVDMENHWKLLTIFVGNNDICSDMCHYNNMNTFFRRHELDLRRALTMLRDNIPHLFVNIMSPPNMVTSLHDSMHNIPFTCTAVHLAGCHCIFNHSMNKEKLQKTAEDIQRFQEIDEYVASLPEFNTNEFAVSYQPGIKNVTLPKLPNGSTDLKYFASDCFHFSQLGHAALANVIWNNMLEPLGDKTKSTLLKPFERFLCPTIERPYLATQNNS